MDQTAGELRAEFEKYGDEFVESFVKNPNEHLTNPCLKRETVADQIEGGVRYEDARDRATRNRYGRPTQTFISRCRACGAHLSPSCPLYERRQVFYFGLGKFVDEIPFPCPACGTDPREYASDKPHITIKPDWQPYVDISFGPDVRGARYVPGEGALIMSRAHAKEVARMNGMRIRPGF